MAHVSTRAATVWGDPRDPFAEPLSALMRHNDNPERLNSIYCSIMYAPQTGVVASSRVKSRRNAMELATNIARGQCRDQVARS
jgi:hypothetical protein